jgi:predicted transcriptional regulator
MDDARAFMLRVDRKAAPVVDGSGKLLGMLKYRDVMKAAQAGKGSQRVKSWMRRDTITVRGGVGVGRG